MGSLSLCCRGQRYTQFAKEIDKKMEDEIYSKVSGGQKLNYKSEFGITPMPASISLNGHRKKQQEENILLKNKVENVREQLDKPVKEFNETLNKHIELINEEEALLREEEEAFEREGIPESSIVTNPWIITCIGISEVDLVKMSITSLNKLLKKKG